MKQLQKVFRTAAAAISLTSCGHVFSPDYSRMELADNYYVESDYEGRSSLYFGSAWLNQSTLLVQPIDSAATVGNCVVVCQAEWQHYYFFSSAAKTGAAAERMQIGPIAKVVYRQKLYQSSRRLYAPTLLRSITDRILLHSRQCNQRRSNNFRPLQLLLLYDEGLVGVWVVAGGYSFAG